MHVFDDAPARAGGVDLVYLDPPINSKLSKAKSRPSGRDYNVIPDFIGTTGALPASQMHAFEDSWHWSDGSVGTDETARTLATLKGNHQPRRRRRK